MQINPQNVLNPYIQSPGLAVTISSGNVLLSGVPTTVPTTIVMVSANTTSYVYLSLTTGLITLNTSGFPTNQVYPIATVVSTASGISTLIDSRPDIFVGVANATGAVLLNPSGAQIIDGFPLSLDGLQLEIVSETSNYTALSTDNLILVDATSGPVTVQLPNTAGAFYRVKKTDSSVNIVTVQMVVGNLDGVANKQLTIQYQSLDVQGDGSNGWIWGSGGVSSTAGYNSTTVGFSTTPVFAASNVGVQHFKITLTGDVTSSSITGISAGQQLIFEIIQDGTGSRLFTWPSNVLNPIDVPGTDPASQVAIQSFVYDGTNLYPTSAGTKN